MNLKRKYLFILALAWFAVNHIGCGKDASPKLAPPVKTEKLRVFVIGNSFSNNATKYLPELVKEKGKLLEIGRAEIGSGSLQNHWDGVLAFEANPTDPKGLLYGGKSLKTLLMDGNWDVVSVQQYSLLSADESSYEPYATNLYDFIKKVQPKAKVVIHQTWAYRTDAKNFGRITAGGNAQSAEEMWINIEAANRKVANRLQVEVVPTGAAFWEVSADPKWAFVRDQSIDPDKFVYPKVTNEPTSLHYGYTWGADGKIAVDYNHASTAGCYLGALVWYGFSFNDDVTTVSYRPDAVSEEFAERLKIAAKKALKP